MLAERGPLAKAAYLEGWMAGAKWGITRALDELKGNAIERLEADLRDHLLMREVQHAKAVAEIPVPALDPCICEPSWCKDSVSGHAMRCPSFAAFYARQDAQESGQEPSASE